ncbi:MAG: glycoside hydrolase family 2 [Clostridia bacterium]|nr:glycoside hydrolase family 2 [Clostridia bacterium]
MSWMDLYPRPQMRRASYYPLKDGWALNGQPIRMPFPPQSPLSGWEGDVPEEMDYEIRFTLPEGFLPENYRLILHVGAADQIAQVIFNGQEIMRHEGGYLPFSMDVTAHLKAENHLRIHCTDTLDHTYPYGKQTQKRGGMWYTPVSGLWQPVWLEAVPRKHIQGLKITPDLTGITLKAVASAPCQGVIRFGDAELPIPLFDPAQPLRIEIPEKMCHLWSPDTPHLYDLELTCGEDRVDSYFALRTFSIGSDQKGVNRLCLNGKPVFLNGVLDQGYFPQGIFLPEDPQEFERDVLRMKELGFNLLRKHIKVEPEIFYHACDRLGMLVMQDMVNNGGYNFILDTALPTIGLKKRPHLPAAPKRKAVFESHSLAILDHLHNYPCVIAYTIFNEGWGQFEADRLYGLMKKADPTRLFDTASGWFTPRETDVDSVHIYFRNKRLKPKKRPLLLSECGGYTRAIDGHLFNPQKQYGYGKAGTARELTDKFCLMYEEMVLPAIPQGLCGVIYTQLSDVEDEINGLYTYDRKVLKVEPEPIKQCLGKAEKELQNAL